MEPLLVHPDPPPPELAQALDLGGYAWKAVADETAAARARARRRLGRRGRSSSATTPRPRSPCAAPLRKRDVPLEPLLLLISGAQLGDLELRDELFDDFCLNPFHPRELEARLRHLFWRTGHRHRARARRVRRARAQPRDLPGRDRRPPARPHLHGVRAAQVPGAAPRPGLHPRDAALAGCGATSTTAAPAPSTSTSGASGPSSARSTPTSSRPCARVGYRFGQSRWS